MLSKKKIDINTVNEYAFQTISHMFNQIIKFQKEINIF